MKRFILIISFIFVFLFSLTGCAGNSAETGSVDKSGSKNDSASQNAAQNNTAGKTTLPGQQGKAINTAEEIEQILNGMNLNSDKADIKIEENTNAVDNSAGELNKILENGSDNINFN
ncbi:MAG: hypothetical protein BGN88_01295 [Clostridiales bacterium 43-6]|nr:MAG: hypothetical protein BGN88_01295 [Clostridiales bacterium 43-6]